MRGYMFRNRWWALVFVGLVLAGVTRIVGTGEGDGALDEAAQQIAKQRDIAEQFTSDTAPTESIDDVAIEFTSDEELIDAAVGDDPTPPDDVVEEPDPEVVPSDEVVIVSQDVAGQDQIFEQY